MLIRLTALVIFLFIGTIHADFYLHPIAQVLDNGQKIQFLDGSIWKVKSDFATAQKWQQGHCISFTQSEYFQNSYYFYNFNLPFTDPLVFWDIGSSLEIELPFVEPPQQGYIRHIKTISSDGSHLTLDDTNQFQITWWNSWTTYKWKANDRIIVFEGVAYEYWIINLDQPYPDNVIKSSLLTSSN